MLELYITSSEEKAALNSNIFFAIPSYWAVSNSKLPFWDSHPWPQIALGISLYLEVFTGDPKLNMTNIDLKLHTHVFPNNKNWSANYPSWKSCQETQIIHSSKERAIFFFFFFCTSTNKLPLQHPHWHSNAQLPT